MQHSGHSGRCLRWGGANFYDDVKRGGGNNMFADIRYSRWRGGGA